MRSSKQVERRKKRWRKQEKAKRKLEGNIYWKGGPRKDVPGRDPLAWEPK